MRGPRKGGAGGDRVAAAAADGVVGRVTSAPVSLREWAERVLFGTSLADKLWRPPAWCDSDRGQGCGDVQAPARDRSLRIAPARHAEALPESLDDPAARGQLFHFFANHELLAAELMALCLLRFPDAPAAFRRGVASTLGDEQRHLRGYLSAMAASSTTLGQYPLGGFLWRVMSPMTDVRDYAAHMALTFEQANLDFALHYARRLEAVGDDDGAQRLRQVHRDEITHVAHGRVWFERWRDRGPSLLQAHLRALRPPMTLRRARGIGFDRVGRHAAGFDDAYIDEIEHYEGSRGRPVTVYELHPTAEHDVALRGGYSPDAATRELIEDLAWMPMFMARPGDVVVASTVPTPAFVARQRAAGFAIPQWFDRRAPPARSDIAAVLPWGWGPEARRRLAPWIRLAADGPPPVETDGPRLSKLTWHDLGAEIAAQEPEGCFGPWASGRIAASVDEVVAVADEYRSLGWPRVVVKAPWGAAGRGMLRIDDARPAPAQRNWLTRTLARQCAVLVEPWLRATADTSIRLVVARDGSFSIDDVGRFVTDARGQYLGAVLGPLSRAVPPSLARALHGHGRDRGRQRRVVERLATAVAQRVHALGYAGPVGIDGVLARDLDDTVRWRPLVEVNARPTFGHVVTGIARQLAPRIPGVWMLLRPEDVRAGLELPGLVAALDDALPPSFAASGRLAAGVVVGGDPTRCRRVLPLALVGRPIPQLLAILAAVAPQAAERIRAALGRADDA